MALLTFATDVTTVWSLGLFVCLSHLCIQLKPLDGMRCHLPGNWCGIK